MWEKFQPKATPKYAHGHACRWKKIQLWTMQQSFSQSSHLNAHKKVHNPNKPFQWKECDKTFKRSAGLTYHTRTHTGEKPLTCRAFSKVFSQSHELKIHQGVHMSIKLPRKCCDKIFNAPTLSRSHIRVFMEKSNWHTQCHYSLRCAFQAINLIMHLKNNLTVLKDMIKPSDPWNPPLVQVVV